MVSKYDGLTHAQLLGLLEARDRTKKLGLVWERDEIEADAAIDSNFVACELINNLSEKSSPWENMVIEGDNFDTLRWLRMTCPGQIKCIYIDPPYNTGNKDWVYNDHYIDPDDRFRQSTWLEFLYRRLTLARDLLTEDGVLLISISDDQRALLELLANEALPGMKVGTLVWRTRVGGNEGGKHFFTSNHESILVYAKKEFRFGGTEKSFSMYRFFDDGRQDYYRISDLTVAVAHNNPRAGRAYYPLRDPSTDIWYPCNPNRVWSFASREVSGDRSKVKTRFMEDWIEAGHITFPENPRVETWHTLDELKDAVANRRVPMSGNTLMISEELPGFEGLGREKDRIWDAGVQEIQI